MSSHSSIRQSSRFRPKAHHTRISQSISLRQNKKPRLSRAHPSFGTKILTTSTSRRTRLVVTFRIPRFKLLIGNGFDDGLPVELQEIINYNCNEYGTLWPSCAQKVAHGQTLWNLKVDGTYDRFVIPGSLTELCAAEFGVGDLRFIVVQARDELSWNAGEPAIVVNHGMKIGDREKWHVWNPLCAGDEWLHDAESVQRVILSPVADSSFAPLKMCNTRMIQPGDIPAMEPRHQSRSRQTMVVLSDSDEDTDLEEDLSTEQRPACSLIKPVGHGGTPQNVNASDMALALMKDSRASSAIVDAKLSISSPSSRNPGFRPDNLLVKRMVTPKGEKESIMVENEGRVHLQGSVNEQPSGPRSPVNLTSAQSQPLKIQLSFVSKNSNSEDNMELLSTYSSVEDLFWDAVYYEISDAKPRILSITNDEGEEFGRFRKKDEEKFQAFVTRMRNNPPGNIGLSRLKVIAIDL